MGDRCFMSVWCRKGDEQQFVSLGFVVQNEGDHEVELIDEEANYQHSEDLPKLKGTFIGSGSCGADYPSIVFACHNGKYAEVQVTDGDDEPSLSVLADGTLWPHDGFDKAMRFHVIRQAACQALGHSYPVARDLKKADIHVDPTCLRCSLPMLQHRHEWVTIQDAANKATHFRGRCRHCREESEFIAVDS